jgi:hypothetical protein
MRLINKVLVVVGAQRKAEKKDLLGAERLLAELLV